MIAASVSFRTARFPRQADAARRCCRRFRSSTSAPPPPSSSRGLSSQAVAWEDDDEHDYPPLVRLQNARIPNDAGGDRAIDLTIRHPKAGGHVLLGRNASGKTALTKAIEEQFRKDRSDVPSPFRSQNGSRVATVSFASHQELLDEKTSKYVSQQRRQHVDPNVDYVSVHKAISGGAGNLSKAAQFLVVRFGLYSLLSRDVRTLSTGEIRKVLLIRALAQNPSLLVLDNAFDGLDVASRAILQELVSKTLQGFGQDILVQGVAAKNTTHTQVLLATHRPEEIVDEITRVSYFDHDRDDALLTESRDGRVGEDLFRLMGDAAYIEDMDGAWDDPSLPSTDAVDAWWRQTSESRSVPPDPVVCAKNLTIQKGQFTLLHNLDWEVERGQRWLLAGGNGAGKSTMSRLLAKPGDWTSGNDDDALQVLGENDHDKNHAIRPGVGWVSTELHLHMVGEGTIDADVTAREVITDGGSDADGYEKLAGWFGMNRSQVLDAPFLNLSQGQQKLVLIIAALAKRPALLVLDEPCQGLDMWNRRRVLGVVERICQSSDMSLVYITHHLEELLPSVSHVLHLKDRRAAYSGTVRDYNPVEVESQEA